MAYNKRTWKARQGTGLNYFSIDGATPVPIVNQPTTLTQVGDALSAGNLNDLEDRIEDAFDDVDTALDTKADEQDVTNLNNALTAIDHRVQNLEQAKGDYIVQSYKDGSITPSGKGAWSIVEGLRGVSRVENQLVNGLYIRPETYGLTREATADGGIRIYGTCTLSTSFTVATMPSVTSGHSYLTSLGATLPAGCRISTSSDDKASSAVSTLSTDTSFGINVTSGMTIDITMYPVARDLTLYFNGTIPSDAQTIAGIQQNYPHLLLPSEYGQRIVDSSYSGVRAWARNLWDEETEVGTINDTTGQNESNPNILRSTNYIPIRPNDAFFFCSPINGIGFYYDISKNYLGSVSVSANALLTAPSGAFYFRFRLASDYGLVYHNDICINQSDSQNGTYTPYHAPSTLSLPSPVTLRSAGSVADTDELCVEVDGVEKRRQTKRTGQVDMGTLNWIYETYEANPHFLLSSKDTVSLGVRYAGGLLCTKFIGTVKTYRTLGNLEMCVDNTVEYPILRIRDDSYTDASTFKASLSGVMLYYELADPIVTLSDPLLDNTLLTESGGRMATVQTGTVVDGSFDMGFINL